ncbi:glycosyltransferase family 4 protein [Dyadobacter psychrotolerans]|uniref:Glycosyltransferase n=1 Tax=Dyadobacter psychrotolerans TaxID=2541721 RepID=A0A4R5DWK0_9BACT|nr:glycosyltransferase family 4 protein [Dyadobacter psychrotolerans]TDE15665.1 glycosyltransferase [Dyadobacter psychrotolerans]
MEILFISHKFPPAVGGMEKQSFELIDGMKRFTNVHSIVYTGQQSRIAFFLSLEKRIQDLCSEYPSISVIHFNDALIATFCLHHKSYAHLYRSVTVHGLDVVFPSTIYQKYILPKFNRFDLIIAVSHATKQACVQRGIGVRKVVVISNGVDHTLLQHRPDSNFHQLFRTKYGIDLSGKTILTTLGRPVKRKGFSWFLQYVLPELEGNLILLMAGPFNKSRTWQDRFYHFLPPIFRTKIELFTGYPADENKIRILLNTKKYSQNVLHLGKLPFEELIQILLATDGFIMPNIAVEGDMEGFGLVCLEASLCGSWVFAADTDGITDAITDQKNGTLIRTGSTSDWTAVLNNFIENPDVIKKQLESAKSYTQNTFSWEKMVSSYWSQFKLLVQTGQKVKTSDTNR